MSDPDNLKPFLTCVAAGAAVLSGYGVAAICVALGLLMLSSFLPGGE